MNTTNHAFHILSIELYEKVKKLEALEADKAQMEASIAFTQQTVSELRDALKEMGYDWTNALTYGEQESHL